MADENCQVIEALEKQWRDALCSRELDRLRELVHPDFLLIGTRQSGPFQMKREEWLDAIQRRDVVDIELNVRDATIFDKTMIGTVEAKWRLKYLGRVIEDCVILTDIWVHEDGRWQAVRRHSTPAPAGECV